MAVRLIELDERNAEIARTGIRDAELDNAEVITSDAGISDHYAHAVPADILVACGVFGNISDWDIAGTVRQFPHLCASGATVIWTRHRAHPDITPEIRRWFEDAGFAELAFVAPETHSSRSAPTGSLSLGLLSKRACVSSISSDV